MAARRTRSIGTKVTDEEYARIEALAGEQAISEWARGALLKAAAPATDSVVLAELLALRTILLNLHFTVPKRSKSAGSPRTVRNTANSSGVVARVLGDYVVHMHGRQVDEFRRVRTLLGVCNSDRFAKCCAECLVSQP